jgi:hypothetical protein
MAFISVYLYVISAILLTYSARRENRNRPGDLFISACALQFALPGFLILAAYCSLYLPAVIVAGSLFFSPMILAWALGQHLTVHGILAYFTLTFGVGGLVAWLTWRQALTEPEWTGRQVT